MVDFIPGDHWAYFGDGNAAKIVDSKDYLKSSGVKWIKFILLPSTRIEQAYDIVQKQDPVTRAVMMEYAHTDVIWLERGVERSRCWIVTDFNGGATPASRRYEELSATLKDTERLLRSAEAAKNRAYQELDIERKQQTQAIKTQMENVMHP